ncbi:leucine-rich repeat domain-containing protein [Algoriphagus lacus]|uniref:Leucine-rich repeat domain-containing protein n=1 Tax=Algoriphagus lacus TaxID=2056311 RepID=A0A418PLL0_9BACT|nr:leucine-rich repeat domain-containing protein [Algoriphagus lacus]RIW12265.1 leucine-rich repeat domain-containing protein [Algoriphagus lacus]
MIKNKHILLTGLFFLINLSLQAQTIKGYTKEEVQEFSAKVEDQVRFLEYLLNTVGSTETPARDKDVIIRESYLKIFRDEKVQVEDDLLLDRKVVTNKDVTAYLKDIEFFYKNVEFKFKIREVKAAQKDNGEVYFLASLDRTLTATSLSGEKITNTKPRFVEVNLQEKSEELKIVSIYTTKVSRDEELTAWWKTMDESWKSYFKERFNLAQEDSANLDWLYRFVSIDSLDISGKNEIKSLSPLSELRDLKVVNISNSRITDLGPISNVTFLESLNLANTSTSDIQFIKYSDRLKHLDISNTQIEDISQLLNLKSLISLKAQKTPVMSFAVLNELKNLTQLDLTESGFNNVENVKDLVKLETLNLSGNYMINFTSLSGLTALKNLNLSTSNLQDLSPLQGLSNLEFLDISGTQVADLTPLESLANLKKISADQTKLTALAADGFVRRNPEILLIHHVKDLESWWAGLSPAWKEALKKNNPAIANDTPGVETLTQTVTLTTLNLDSAQIENLNPVTRFVNLAKIDFSNNPVSDLLPLSEVKTLVTVTGKNTQVSDLSAIKSNELLERIDLEFSPVKSIKDIVALPKLSYLNVNGGEFFKEEVPEILIQKPEMILVYRTDELNTWWEKLDSQWKEVLRRQFSLGEIPDTDQLHVLTGKSELVFERVSISDLQPITAFSNLRSLTLFDAPVSSVSPISGMKLLTKLRLSQLPVMDFLPLSGLSALQELDISNTGIEDLSPISNLFELKILNLSGTNLKSLKGLETLVALEELDVASTNLRSLKPLEGLSNLKKLSCFNTNLTTRAVDSFKSTHPDCEVRFY